MITTSLEEKAHALVGQLPANQLAAVVRLMETMVDAPEDELTDADIQAIQDADRRIANGEPMVSLEELVADLGFSMEQIRAAGKDGRP